MPMRQRQEIQGLLREIEWCGRIRVSPKSLNNRPSSLKLSARLKSRARFVAGRCAFRSTCKKSLAAFAAGCHLLASAMRKAMTILSFREARTRRVWAAFSLVLFLTLQLLSSSTALHKLVHADAGSLDHHCAITLLSRGQVNAMDAIVPLVAFVAALLFLLPVLQPPELASFAYRFSASRAPPRR